MGEVEVAWEWVRAEERQMEKWTVLWGPWVVMRVVAWVVVWVVVWVVEGVVVVWVEMWGRSTGAGR